jgi:hypothetical protein
MNREVDQANDAIGTHGALHAPNLIFKFPALAPKREMASRSAADCVEVVTDQAHHGSKYKGVLKRRKRNWLER